MYEEKLVGKVVSKVLRTLFLPTPLARIYTLLRSIPYLVRGVRCLLRGKLQVELLDGISIGISMARLFHRRFRHVSTGIGGTSGGVDPQKVCG